jgi:hypothetical protein
MIHSVNALLLALCFHNNQKSTFTVNGCGCVWQQFWQSWRFGLVITTPHYLCFDILMQNEIGNKIEEG